MVRTLALLLLLPLPALADAAVPSPPTADDWWARCEARLAQARDEVARIVPAAAQARIERVDAFGKVRARIALAPTSSIPFAGGRFWIAISVWERDAGPSDGDWHDWPRPVRVAGQRRTWQTEGMRSVGAHWATAAVMHPRRDALVPILRLLERAADDCMR